MKKYRYKTKINKTLILFLILIMAIVIIAATLSFKPEPSNSVACISITGYTCQNYILNTSGFLSFTIAETISNNLYNVKFACASGVASNGGPAPGNLTFNNSAKLGNNQLKYGIPTIVSQLDCYNSNNTILSNMPLATLYKGYIWIEYTNSSAIPSISNPYHVQKIFMLWDTVT